MRITSPKYSFSKVRHDMSDSLDKMCHVAISVLPFFVVGSPIMHRLSLKYFRLGVHICAGVEQIHRQWQDHPASRVVVVERSCRCARGGKQLQAVPVQDGQCGKERLQPHMRVMSFADGDIFS